MHFVILESITISDDDKANEIETLKEAEADLRRELIGLLPDDQVETEWGLSKISRCASQFAVALRI